MPETQANETLADYFKRELGCKVLGNQFANGSEDILLESEEVMDPVKLTRLIKVFITTKGFKINKKLSLVNELFFEDGDLEGGFVYWTFSEGGYLCLVNLMFL